jgi:hypothetical protein
MGGKGDSLVYRTQERNGETKERFVTETTTPSEKPSNALEYVAQNLKNSLSSRSLTNYIKPAIVIVTIILLIFLGALGQRIFRPGTKRNRPCCI